MFAAQWNSARCVPDITRQHCGCIVNSSCLRQTTPVPDVPSLMSHFVHAADLLVSVHPRAYFWLLQKYRLSMQIRRFSWRCARRHRTVSTWYMSAHFRETLWSILTVAVVFQQTIDWMGWLVSKWDSSAWCRCKTVSLFCTGGFLVSSSKHWLS